VAAVGRILIARAEIAGLSLATAPRRPPESDPRPGQHSTAQLPSARLVTFHAFIAGGVPSGTLATTTGPAWVGV
jgi:hypothetical protein